MLFVGTSIVYGADINTRVRLKLENELGFADSNLVFGIHSLATDSTDFNLGEKNLPPFPPPAPELFCVFNLDSNDIAGLWSYLDLRSIPENENVFTHKYEIKLYKRSTSLVTVSWQGLNPEITEAIISDKLGGVIFKADMKKENSVLINNPFLSQLNILLTITYDKRLVSVEDDLSSYSVYPNPATDRLIVETKNSYKYEILDMFGASVANGSLEGTKNNINVTTLNSGLYLLKLYNLDNTIIVNKFIKY